MFFVIERLKNNVQGSYLAGFLISRPHFDTLRGDRISRSFSCVGVSRSLSRALSCSLNDTCLGACCCGGSSKHCLVVFVGAGISCKCLGEVTIQMCSGSTYSVPVGSLDNVRLWLIGFAHYLP